MAQATASDSINIVTDVPGPRSRELAERSRRALPEALTLVHPVYVDRAHGAMVTDVDGNTFIDWIGGVGVMNVGHTHEAVTEAIIEQARRFTHTDYTIVPYEPYVELCERLNATAPFSGEARTALFNTGAETVENAVKISRVATGRSGVVCFSGAFHGRSLMAMTLTSKVHPYRAGFGPYAPEVYRAPFADSRHFGDDPERASREALERLRMMVKTHFASEEIACIIVEPVQGEGGFIVPPQSYLEGLREIADEWGSLLVFDEVQSGMGRTGKMWAAEHFGVEPDLVLSAKSIAAGVPLGAVIGRQQVMDTVPDSAIGGTYPGNPLACRASLAVLDALQDGLLERGRVLGERLEVAFDELMEQDEGIGYSRGLGAMRAIEFVVPGTREGDAERTDRVVKLAAQRGLLLHKAGVRGSTIRVLVPLVITDEQLEASLEVLRTVIAETR